MIVWKDGKVDRNALIRMVHPDGSSNDPATNKDELADALDECVAALIYYSKKEVDSQASYTLRKIGVEE